MFLEFAGGSKKLPGGMGSCANSSARTMTAAAAMPMAAFALGMGRDMCKRRRVLEDDDAGGGGVINL